MVRGLGVAERGKSEDMAVGESRTFTRSEEELSYERRVRTVRRVRVRKRIVEEWVEVRVPVRREELEIVEEDVPVGEGPGGDEALLSEQTLEVVLHREEPVVTTRPVAHERVTITRHVVAGTQEMADTLRQEVIDLEELPPRT